MRRFQRIRSLSLPGMAAVALLAVAGVFLAVQPTNAGILGFLTESTPAQVILTVIGVVLEWLVYGVVSLLLMVVGLLVSIAQYTGFGEARAVNVGWAIVRDLTNMFFVLLMLIIAFGTILGVEEFSYRRMLPRLLIMAVLINFSKVIAGIFIDFSQVIMLTFVNGFAAVAGANIVSMLQMNKISSLSPGDTGVSAAQPNALADLVAGYFLALVMMGLALAVMLIMMVILVFRIVMLWLLVIMSPLAFFLSTFPRGRAAEAYGKWWSEFGNYLTIGPFLAFFLWLSFAVAGSGSIGAEGFPSQERPAGAETTRVNTFITTAAEPQNAISYVVGIALLMGGMMLSQQFSVLGGSMIGGAANWVKDKGAKAAKAPLGMMRKGAELGWKGTKVAAGVGALAMYSRTGLDVRPSTWKKAGAAMLASTKGRLEKEGLQAAVRRKSIFGSPQVLQEVWGQGGLKGVSDIVAARRNKGVGADAARRSDTLRAQEKDMREQAKRVMDEPDWMQKRADLTNREGQITAQLQNVGLAPAARENLQKELSQVRLNAAELDDRRNQNLVLPDTNSANAERGRLETQADAAARAAAPLEETARRFKEPRIAIYERTEQEDMEKARKELPDYTMDTGEITRRFIDAVKEGKSADARLYAEVAAKQNDLGDLIQASGTELRGRAYATDKAGVDEFRREVFGERLGMDDQKSMRVMHGLGEKTEDRSLKAQYAVNGNTGNWRGTTAEEQLGIMLKKIDGLSPKRLAETLKPSDLQVLDERGNKVLSALGQAILEKVPSAISQAMATNRFDVKSMEAIKSMGTEITSALGAQGQTLVQAAERYSSSAVSQRSNIDRLVQALGTRLGRP